MERRKLLKKDRYIVNETYFMTESREYLYITVDQKHYKLNFNLSLRDQIDRIIQILKIEGTIEPSEYDEKIFNLLIKIKAIKKETDKKNIILRLFDENKNICKKIKECSREDLRYKIDFSEKGFKFRVLDNGKFLVIFKENKKMNEIESIEVSDIFINYLIEVILEKHADIEELNIDETQILLINLNEYSNESIFLSDKTRDFNSNILLNERINSYSYEFKEFFPMIKLNYKNFLGYTVTTFGDSKDECKYNLYLKLKELYDEIKVDIHYKSQLDSRVFKDIVSLYFNTNSNDVESFGDLNYGQVFEKLLWNKSHG